MPKMKTHKGAAARVKVTGTGKLRRRHMLLNHKLQQKSPDRKRRLGRDGEIAPADTKKIKRLLGL